MPAAKLVATVRAESSSVKAAAPSVKASTLLQNQRPPFPTPKFREKYGFSTNKAVET
jgi:hypothetical protein